jgi:hypothetical protein
MIAEPSGETTRLKDDTRGNAAAGGYFSAGRKKTARPFGSGPAGKSPCSFVAASFQSNWPRKRRRYWSFPQSIE